LQGGLTLHWGDAMAQETITQLLILVGAIGGPIGAYYGAISAIKVEIAKLEQRMVSLEKAHDSDHAKLDSLYDRVRASRGSE